MAYPIFPLERLERYLTGSRGSWVLPAVTRIHLPSRSLLPVKNLTTSATMASGSGNLPFPVPQAKSPVSGSMNIYPRFARHAMFSWKMGFSYMFTFIEGANITGDLVDMTTVVRMSSAIPALIFPITFAVAGAIKIKSAHCARLICLTPTTFLSGNISVTTSFSERVSSVRGVTNFWALSVITTIT
jgi:hypothetical protein